MRKLNYNLILFLSLSVHVCAQTSSSTLQKQMRFDIGVWGSWLNYELPVAEQYSIVSELGIIPYIFGGEASSNGYALSTRLLTGVRYYYKPDERSADNAIFSNTGYFISLFADYQPPRLTYISVDDRAVSREFRIIPSWGLRKVFGSSRWSFEGRLGIGYSASLDNRSAAEKHSLAYDLRASISYKIF